VLRLSCYNPCSLFKKIGAEGRTGSAHKGGWRRGEVAQTMYTPGSKCKNDKIKERGKKRILR
jgi:hypothetical protein